MKKQINLVKVELPTYGMIAKFIHTCVEVNIFDCEKTPEGVTFLWVEDFMRDGDTVSRMNYLCEKVGASIVATKTLDMYQ